MQLNLASDMPGGVKGMEQLAARGHCSVLMANAGACALIDDNVSHTDWKCSPVNTRQPLQ